MGFLDGLLDRSILFSFDRSGFERHALGFRPADLRVELQGRVALVTGASSGLGLAAARTLAALGAEVHLGCRSEARGRAALDEIRASSPRARVRLAPVDLADLGSVRALAERFAPERLDVLVHNAGVLAGERELTADGLERSLATNVVGPFLLTRLLLPKLLRSRDARLVHVSSGGMYARRLELADLDWRERPFDGVLAYAQTKRMEVVLAELWAELLDESRVAVSAMHPGWADTPGLRRSLPVFHGIMSGRLRTPEQGADTIVWLSARPEPPPSGLFWFDREPVATHLLPWTEEAAGDRRALWALCERLTGGPLAQPRARARRPSAARRARKTRGTRRRLQ